MLHARGLYFYPRSPCGERRKPCCPAGPGMQFLSTLSLRRATPCNSRLRLTVSYFYPRSPCGERQTLAPKPNQKNLFLSTLSLRRATTLIWDVIAVMTISIHALLAESDFYFPSSYLVRDAFLSTLSLRRATALVWCSCGGVFDFYPRSPCGERQMVLPVCSS